MKRKKATNSEIGLHKRVSVKHRRRKKLTNIASLPDDLLFNILVLLPAQDVHDNVRFVCKKWYAMTSTRAFKFAHYDHTPSGLLIPDQCNNQLGFFVGMEQGQIEVSNFNFDLGNPVWGSCQGLILEHKKIDTKFILFISNPVMKRKLALPEFCVAGLLYIASFGLAYSVASMLYKVVITYGYWNSEIAKCVILTVGVDNTWRQVDVQHLSRRGQIQLVPDSLSFYCLPTPSDLVPRVFPIITEGFMHWSTNYSYFSTLNVESETFREILSPRVHGPPTNFYCFSSGRNLSLLIEDDGLSWKVCEMEPQAGEWTDLWLVDLNDRQSELQQFNYEPVPPNPKRLRNLRPVGWLKYKEVLVLGRYDAFQTFVVYDVGKGEISSFQLSADRRNRYHNNMHRRSLIWLDI